MQDYPQSPKELAKCLAVLLALRVWRMLSPMSFHRTVSMANLLMDDSNGTTMSGTFTERSFSKHLN